MLNIGSRRRTLPRIIQRSQLHGRTTQIINCRANTFQNLIAWPRARTCEPVLIEVTNPIEGPGWTRDVASTVGVDCRAIAQMHEPSEVSTV